MEVTNKFARKNSTNHRKVHLKSHVLGTSPEYHRVCAQCKRTDTPLWRAGPDGEKNLCNACGIRWKRGVTKKKDKPNKKKKLFHKTKEYREQQEEIEQLDQDYKQENESDEEIEESVIEHSPPEKMMTSFRAESTIENETTVTTYAFTQTTSFRYEQTELDTELSLFLDQLSQEQVDGFNQKIHLDTQISVGYGSYLTELNV